MKRCPFLKRTIYNSGRNTGGGYPLEWIAAEEFEECIGDKCTAYQVVDNCYTGTKSAYCELCGKQDINVET